MKLYAIRFASFLISICSFLGAQSQTTLTIQPDALSGKDAFVDSRRSSQNFGSTPDHLATAWTNGGTTVIGRALLDFDLSSIPANSTITSAQLFLYGYTSLNNVGHSTQSGPNDAVIRRITQPWAENSVNWNNQPNVTTVNEVMLPATTATNDNRTANVTNMVQDMVDSSLTSFGFLMKLNTEVQYRSMLFASSDNIDSTIHPKLVVTYTTSTGINDQNAKKLPVQIYPNPFSNQLITIDMSSLGGNKDIVVFGAQGRTVYSKSTFSSKMVLDLNNLSNGLYYIRIIDEDRNLVTKKLKKI